MTAERYNAQEQETHWQSVWAERETFKTGTDPDKPKCYILEMFPYPSGRIHMGHVRNYAMGDVLARYKRAKGFNVLHPMGWDAFGMPAENAAMQNNTHPGTWTYANIDAMKAQLKSMGLAIDWSREFATCDVDYYAQQQRLFLDMLDKGLAYRKSSKVNWDPVDQTVLANEQVIDGKGWRSGAEVEQRELVQWFFKISDFSDDLLSALDGLDKWPEKVRLMQANWIGKSEGLMIRWALSGDTPAGHDVLDIYTTRPDTIFGASFMAIAPDHPLARKLSETNPELADFCEECRRMGTSVADIESAEKQGFDTGLKAIHPFDPNWEVPVYVANFILMDYGTGAIFGCPSGDQRDIDFARKYGLPVIPVVAAGRRGRAGCGAGGNRSRNRLHGRWRHAQLALPRRDGDGCGIRCGRGQARRRDACWRTGRGTPHKLPPARLGYFAPALLGLPDSGRSLRKLRCRARSAGPVTGEASRRCVFR
jgi:leucyl-tRNA synthetase